MMALCNAGITSEAAYQAVRNVVDVPNLIDYMILHIFGEAEDWPQQGLDILGVDASTPVGRGRDL